MAAAEAAAAEAAAAEPMRAGHLDRPVLVAHQHRGGGTLARGADDPMERLSAARPYGVENALMRLPFIPREEKFFELFIEDAQNVLAGARMLEELFRSYDQRERLASQLRDAEHRGDVLSHDIGQRLATTFVTPFDREDIHHLISRLDDILDFIEEVADTCVLYKIDRPTEPAAQQATIIVRQCEELVRALEKLHSFKDVQAHWIEIHRLENEGDRVARQAVADLFTNGEDPVHVIKWKDVYALLEEAIDACEDAANVIERIVVTHA